MKTLLALIASVGLLTATTASARDFHHHSGFVHRGGFVGHSHVGFGIYPSVGIGVSPYYGGPYYDGYYADPYPYYGGVEVYGSPGYYYSGGHRYYRGGGFSHGHSSHGSSHHHH